MGAWGKFGGTISGLLMLSGCAALPASGPAVRDITGSAAESRVDETQKVTFDYVFLDIDRKVVDNVIDVGPAQFYKSFGTGRGPAPAIRVGVGDVIQISIFESSAGGLFVSGEGGNRAGNSVTLPQQIVDRAGFVSVPFAGRIRAVGRSLPELERDVEKRLANRAIEPQVIATFTEQNAAEVSVLSDGVGAGGAVIGATNRYRLRPSGDTILDLISRSGGLRYPGYETFVTLQRGNRKARVYFPTLLSNPAENIYASPGDIIFVQRQQQKYVAVGAFASVGQTSGLTGQFAFDQEHLSLNEALAKAGGLLDERANPASVFVYRLEYRSQLEKLGVSLAKFPPHADVIPVVYKANFRDPSSFFSAQLFPIRHKDIIYAGNADSVQLNKFLFFVRSITSTTAGVAQDALVTRDSIRALRN